MYVSTQHVADTIFAARATLTTTSDVLETVGRVLVWLPKECLPMFGVVYHVYVALFQKNHLTYAIYAVDHKCSNCWHNKKK